MLSLNQIITSHPAKGPSINDCTPGVRVLEVMQEWMSKAMDYGTKCPKRQKRGIDTKN